MKTRSFVLRLWTLIACAGLPGLGWFGVALGGELDPIPRGSWPGFLRGPANAVAVSGSYAYVAAGDVGLQVIDISNPTNALAVGGYDTSGYASGLAV